jgi:ATP-dependent DNA helicase PIF1
MQSELSIEQSYAFERFKLGHNILITGPGGTGKTKLIKHLVDHAKNMGKSTQVCALTGCASILLGCNAKTIHSWSGMRLGKGTKEEIIAQIMRSKFAKKNWKSVKILIIDEVSMLSMKLFEVLELAARVLRGNQQVFGGIQIVFSGDFYQLGPIGSPNEPDTSKFCFESPKWNQVFSMENHVILKTMYRQSDPKYIEILSQIRIGEISPENVDVLKNYVKREYDQEEYNGCPLMKLFPVRSRADYVNQLMFDKIEEPIEHFEIVKMRNCKTFLDTTKPIDEEVLLFCSQLTRLEIESELEQLILNTPCIPELDLKKGTAVMCTVNLDMDRGICNGSMGTVIDFVGENKLPKVLFSNGITITLSTHFWQSEQYPTIAIGQYPLQLAWALTIHKIQGATLERAQIDIGQSIFEYGQTYVALSRIQSLDGLYLSGFQPGRIKANPNVRAFYDSIEKIENNYSIHPTVEQEKTSSELDFDKYVYVEPQVISKNQIKIVKLN